MLSALVATSSSEPLHQTLHRSCFSRYERLCETTLQILFNITHVKTRRLDAGATMQARNISKL